MVEPRGAVRSHYFVTCRRNMDNDTCPDLNSIPVWVLDLAQRQASLVCLTAVDVGRRIQEEQCSDDQGQLVFNEDGRLVCLND